MSVIGIDPGKTGAWVELDMKGKLINCGKMLDVYKMRDFFKSIAGSDVHIFMEKAQSMPRNGAVAMFNYGHAYGQLEGIMIAYDFKYTLIRPAQWTREMHMGTPEGDPKFRSDLAAHRLFPKMNFVLDGCKIPHKGVIDAALIAEFGRRQLCKS